MKKTSLMLGAALAAFAASAHADTTVTLTGASAFRSAALATIKARFASTGQPFKFAHDAAAGGVNGSTRSVWVGTFPNVAGTTTIRATFNGSVEGLSALIDNADGTTYLQPTVLAGTTATVGGAELPATTSPAAVSAPADLAFSDVSKNSTPFAATAFQPLSPNASRAGVVTFSIVANEGAPAALTSVTTQQFRALFTTGNQPLSLFTGNAANTSRVFATGRNDGSGTRTIYLAETGYGITNTVQQYLAGEVSGDTITKIYRVPAGGVLAGVTSGSANRSTIWGQDVDGNGGYSSGSTLRGDMARTTASTQVLDADGSVLYPAGSITLLTWLSTADAAVAITGGAKAIAYNGVGIAPTTTGLSAGDKAKVTEGQYTAWGYERFYRRPALSSATDDKVKVYNEIMNNIGSNLGGSGIPISDMHVSRSADGGLVGP
jgi:hypothetical protein